MYCCFIVVHAVTFVVIVVNVDEIGVVLITFWAVMIVENRCWLYCCCCNYFVIFFL